MRRETQNSSPRDRENTDYKKFTEDDYKRYAKNIKMFPVNDTPKEYDPYKDLTKKSRKLLKIVRPAVKEKQDKIDDYNPKPFGEKRTYSQDWSSYNKTQMREKIILINILNELLDNILFKETKKVGRNPIRTRDKIFYLVLQAYNIKSSRRCIADLDLCRQLDFVEKTPHFNTILKCLKDSTLEMYFKHLINVSGLPLQQVESDFAVDSSGFSTSQFDRWFKTKHVLKSSTRRYRKAHITCGVKTNIITAVNITKGNRGDSPEFKGLVKTTNKVFDVKEVSADKAYLSRDNLEFVSNMGAIAYIPFKSNTKGRPKGPWIWRKMFDMYSKHREEFMMHYHKRSNSETCFHMIKMKFGSNVRTKNETSQNNEVLAKCLAHNLCVLAQEAAELDIDIDFKKCADIPIAHN